MQWYSNVSTQIADFGLLRHASKGQTETVNVKGTPHYMAPEAMRGDISIKIDVYSFGAVLLEIVTGLEPVDDDRENRDIVRVVTLNTHNKCTH